MAGIVKHVVEPHGFGGHGRAREGGARQRPLFHVDEIDFPGAFRLQERADGLKHVVYHNKLGSQAERMLRVKTMAGLFADLIGADRAKAERAALLAKADLRTLMVGEFPELQGIMGEYYAKYDGEAEEVALAIREHYQPRYAGDALPSTPVSLATALADKMETLIGLFGIGQMPTGEKDPFALRRHALGVLRMLIEKALPVSLNTLIDAAWEAEKAVPGVTDHREELRQFFQDRLRVMLRDAGYTTLEVDAVLALNPGKLDELPKRLAAVRAFMALPEAEALTAANKRIGEVRRKISALGTPNLGAIDEYARVSERYEYLTAQRDDVQHAKSELETIVASITTEMTEIFVREFARIDEYFGKTFAEMFGGGKASLILEDKSAPLECGIEIRVQPPGKQVKTITLLSGGEKAFVAIALYFAILKVRPTPFCMLDEIDAALDDRNVERFASYLHTLSDKTQFIVITHRRGTMEAADVLYGVTMQEQGVSKILRLSLDELAKQLGITA